MIAHVAHNFFAGIAWWAEPCAAGLLMTWANKRTRYLVLLLNWAFCFGLGMIDIVTRS